MTPRSPKHHHQTKTTTISRRLRNRADQNLSVQPPVIPPSRGLRSYRAASPRHNPADYQTPESQTLSLAWDTPDTLENIQRSNTSNPSNTEGSPSSNLLFAQALEFPTYESTPGLQPGLVSSVGNRTQNYQQSTPALSSLPSPLPSVSGSHDFDLRVSADPEQPHNPFLELQDMRYECLSAC